MRKFKDVNELVIELNPDYPVYCIRPNSIKKSLIFQEKFSWESTLCCKNQS